MNTIQDTEETLVVFRKWKQADAIDGHSNILALFPDVEHHRHYCMSYEHVGQHGAADYGSCLERTTAATPEEYRDLHRELEQLGYRLQIKRRR